MSADAPAGEHLALPGIVWLRLAQITSPSLPIGAYAYSQGLEAAVERGWVRDPASAGEWILGLLDHVLPATDVPVLARMHRAWSARDGEHVRALSARLSALRESAEQLAEDRHLGGAFARLLFGLGVAEAEPWIDDPDVTYAGSFALAAVHFRIPLHETAMGYLYAWCEHQVSAATRLVPLGQLAAQELLSAAIDRIPAAAEAGLAVEEEHIGLVAPGQAMASALHETQYSRLFRS